MRTVLHIDPCKQLLQHRTGILHRVREKRGRVIFNYNSRISWSIFIIFAPLETGMNTLQQCEITFLKA